jgi:hypothetical protein
MNVKLIYALICIAIALMLYFRNIEVVIGVNILTLLLLIIMINKNNMEFMSTSVELNANTNSEALQNIASVFNNGQMDVGNLHITGNLIVDGSITSSTGTVMIDSNIGSNSGMVNVSSTLQAPLIVTTGLNTKHLGVSESGTIGNITIENSTISIPTISLSLDNNSLTVSASANPGSTVPNPAVIFADDFNGTNVNVGNLLGHQLNVVNGNVKHLTTQTVNGTAT